MARTALNDTDRATLRTYVPAASATQAWRDAGDDGSIAGWLDDRVTADSDVGNVTGDLTLAWNASGIATWSTT